MASFTVTIAKVLIIFRVQMVDRHDYDRFLLCYRIFVIHHIVCVKNGVILSRLSTRNDRVDWSLSVQILDSL